MGRIYQKVSPIFRGLDSLVSFIRSRKSKGENIIFLIAPPRSGSTLTYQLISSGMHCLYLSNIWNLLYATPIIGGLITKLKSSNHKSSFKSVHGFVPGLFGEAEGLIFWKYWLGQGMTQHAENLNLFRLRKLKFKFEKLLEPNEFLVFGYINHVFCIKELYKIFPNSLFIYLKRDLISNAASLYKASPNTPYSSIPQRLMLRPTDDMKNYIVHQLLEIHKIIQETIPKDRFLEVKYEEVCKEPIKVLKEISSFANSYDFSATLKTKDSCDHVLFDYSYYNGELRPEFDKIFKEALARDEYKNLVLNV
jgi:hypothetical protein